MRINKILFILKSNKECIDEYTRVKINIIYIIIIMIIILNEVIKFFAVKFYQNDKRGKKQYQ